MTTTSEKYEESFGFTFGTKTNIYNPWSIINYLDKRVFRSYWANTSGNGLIGKMVREGNPDIKMAMEDLLCGQLLCRLRRNGMGPFWKQGESHQSEYVSLGLLLRESGC